MNDSAALQFTLARKSNQWTVYGMVIWPLTAALLLTIEFHFPSLDPRQSLGLVLALISTLVLTLQTWATLLAFRAFALKAKYASRWTTLLICLLGWLINVSLGVQGLSIGLLLFSDGMPTIED